MDCIYVYTIQNKGVDMNNSKLRVSRTSLKGVSMNNLTTLSKWGNSLALRIPKSFLEVHNLKDGDTLAIESKGESIILTKQRTIKRYKPQDILGGFHTASEMSEMNWGKPQGSEVW